MKEVETMRLKPRKSEVITFAIVALALLVVGTLFDLPISIALFNKQNLFGNIFAAFGETPGMLVGAFCAAAMITTRNKQVTWKSITAIIGYGLLMVTFSLGAAIMPRNYLDIPFAICVALVPIYIVLALLAATKLAQTNRDALRRAAVVGLLLAFAAMLVINIIKIFWGRPRMRIMENPAAEFTPWYLPQGIAASDEYKSFPSGHSANAAIIVWITLLPTFWQKAKGKVTEIILAVVAYGWTLAVMLSRIIMGAHFLTDTVMGAGLSICMFFILRNIVANFAAKREKT